jgi:hypothetical protein
MIESGTVSVPVRKAQAPSLSASVALAPRSVGRICTMVLSFEYYAHINRATHTPL